MRITVTLSNGAIETEPDDDPLRVRVFARHTPDGEPKPLTTFEAFTKHVERLQNTSVKLQLQEMALTLSRTNRKTDPTSRSLWLLCFMVPPPFMVELQLRAGFMDAGDSQAAEIRYALKRAAQAVGWGDRGSGRPKKAPSFTTS